MKIITLKVEVLGGTNIHAACEQAVNIAKQNQVPVEFDFNDILLTAKPDSDPESIAKFFGEEYDRRRAAYEASPEYKQSQEQAAAAQAARDADLKAALAVAPATMTLRDDHGWKTSVEANTDPYGAAVMIYAERWARLMEGSIAAGQPLEIVAEQCSHLADVEGITGFMHGCAVKILSRVWIHGEDLRRWHNHTTQIGTEGDKANTNGGVLNPAMITIK